MEDFLFIIVLFGGLAYLLLTALFVLCFLDCTGMLDDYLYGGGPDD